MAANAEFRQLIDLFLEINNYSSEREQLDAIERRLVEAELNPYCLDLDDMKHALELLRKIDLVSRKWQETPEELEVYFY